MKFTLKPTDITEIESDALVFFGSDTTLPNLIKGPVPLAKILKRAVEREEFKGEFSKTLVISAPAESPSYKFIIVGLGKEDEFDYFKLQETVGHAIAACRQIKARKITISIMEDWMKKFGAATAVQAVVEAVILSSYQFHKFKSSPPSETGMIEEVILSVTPSRLSSAEEGVRIGQIFAEATIFARDLVNDPPRLTTPTYLAKVAELIAKSSKDEIKVKILDQKEIETLGMNAFLGVSRGSDEPPKFIRLHFKPRNPKKKVVIAGKGITFDTGGLSLKDSKNMETMKLDMAGAAAVLSVFQVISKLKINYEVVGLIAACENMPSGKALKPGDILQALNGKTIEVLNTDAEGRLTLSDVLSYAADKEKADEIIDLATLTGACVVALGEDIAGLWGSNDKLLQKIEECAKSAGEKLWRMPLESDYKELIKSHIADVKNIGGKWGGAITASLFLHEFVGNTPWIHIDIAGPAYTEKNTPLSPIGGTGYGTRLLLRYLISG